MVRPLLVFCVWGGAGERCFIQRLVRAAVEQCGSEGGSTCRIAGREVERPPLAARLLYVNQASPTLLELWLRVSGERGFLEAFETALKREKGVSYQVVSRTRHSMVVRVLVPRLERCLSCSWCPLTSAPLGSMVKSIIFTPDFMLLEVLAAKQQALRELEQLGCQVVYTSEAEEAEYALTERQEEALVTAFLEGYYSYPRRVAAKELAAELGVSGSALAELLRKAEHRIIAKYVMEELPHLLVQVLMRGRRLLVEEAAGRERGG